MKKSKAPERKNNAPIKEDDRWTARLAALHLGHELGEFWKNGTVTIAPCTKCGERVILHEVTHANGRSTGNALNFTCRESHGTE